MYFPHSRVHIYYEILEKKSRPHETSRSNWKKEVPWIREKGHFATPKKTNLQWFKQNPKIHREKQMVKWAKQAREKETLTLTISSAWALSRSLFLAVWWRLLFLSKKICKSNSRTKARGNVNTLLEAFPIMTPYALRYRFTKTFVLPLLAFF